MDKLPPQADAGRTYGGETLNDRQARRREAFLDAGLLVFGSSGYRQATVRQLCKQAELTDRYFYESFGSLEDLLVAVYEREFGKLEQRLLAVLAQTAQSQDPMAGIRMGLDALFTMAKDPGVARVCWMEVLGVSPRVDQVYKDCVDRFGELILQAARMHLPQWRPTPTEARLLGVGLVGAIVQTVTHWLMNGHKESKRAMVDATSQLFEGLMLVALMKSQGARGLKALSAASPVAAPAAPKPRSPRTTSR
jgi:AcrR family transcriptional regulator